MWVRAIDLYSKVFKEVEPKRKRVADAQAELAATQAKLKEKQDALAEIEGQLTQLKNKYEESMGDKILLARKAEETSTRLQRASKLTVALKDEELRWTQSVAKVSQQLDDLVGDIFLAAASVAYFGAFTSDFRQQVVSHWISLCQARGIPVSPTFTLGDALADPVQVREWAFQGLPSDALSVENGILVTRGRRWPLMIDPQGQANRWIRKMEGANLKVVKLSEPKFLRSLENAVRLGQPVLLEDIGETLDPALEPLLLKQVVRQGGRLLLKLGDSLVEYDKNFRLYITTKLSNPHYMPEVCIKVTIINFTVTTAGLEGQLLGDVVKLERPELEEQRDRLVVSLAKDKNSLKEIEEKILKMLSNSKGNILDDEELIQTLNQSKVTSADIMERVKMAEETELQINTAREKYRPVALRGSILYFVLANLSEIDPMYQFSLRYFKNLFTTCIQQTAKQDDLEQHIALLCDNITTTVFNNISRALFEQHKIIFSFMICADILRQDGRIEASDWNVFLRGVPAVVTMGKSAPPKPNVTWLTDSAWKNCFEVGLAVPALRYVCDHILANPTDWQKYTKTERLLDATPPGGAHLRDFQKMLLIKALVEEKLVASITAFIAGNLGQDYISMPAFELNKVFSDLSPITPLIFVLSPGSDPVSLMLKFARERGYSDRLFIISLGQGQGPIAEDLLKRSVINGDWVFLQNCHLSASWMPTLENTLKNLAAAAESSEGSEQFSGGIHPDFRLFLSSMPSKVFPISILQDGVKVTNESPKGLRANLMRVFADMNKDMYDNSPPQGARFKKLVYGVCFFNAMIHERKRFGPLGWNIDYDWSAADLEVSVVILRNLLAEYEKTVPWSALKYLTGEITFGGRVTDDWDRRCLKSVLGRFYTPKMLDDGFKFSPSGVYQCPPECDLQSVRAFVEKLPLTEEPEVFGMHENANISYQMQESRRLLRTVLEVQPRIMGAANGLSYEDIANAMASSILETWPALLDIDITNTSNTVTEELFRTDAEGRMNNSLSTVLLQETARSNNLLSVVRASLEALMKAIKGLVVMSPDLEVVFKALLTNEVPASWANVAYPSLKPLSSWVKDLHERVLCLRNWAEHGQPTNFWLSGFFFPQGFISACTMCN
jgi:dynein heavy chain